MSTTDREEPISINTKRSISGPHVCPVCNKSFSRAWCLKIHEPIHTGERSYACEECDRCFTNKQSVREHVLRYHRKDFSHICEYCDKGFISKCHLRHHQLSHMRQADFICSCCDKRFKTSGKLKRHMLTYSSERQYVCMVCSKRFNCVTNLKSHELIHTDERPFACKYCSTTFRHDSNLRVHIRSHTGERPYSCKKCDATFAHSSHLNRHAFVHADKAERDSRKVGNILYCKKCNKAFGSQTALRRHKLKHDRPKVPFACLICDRTFSRMQDLKRHNFVHTSNPPSTDERQFICVTCNSGFTSISRLKIHELSHSSVTHPFACKICDKSYNRMDTLRRHELNHTGEFPFSCNTCDKRFILKQTCRSHEQTHIVNRPRPFICETCKKTFTDISCLRSHAHSHSGGQKFACNKCDKKLHPQSVARHMKLLHGSSIKRSYERKTPDIKVKSPSRLKKHLETRSKHPTNRRKDTTSDEIKPCKCEKQCECQPHYTCNKYDVKFVHSKSIGRHMKLKHTSVDPLQQCTQHSDTKQQAGVDMKKRFNGHSKNQTNHRRRNCTDDKSRRHECDKCRKRFPSRYHLTRHLTIHRRRGKSRNILSAYNDYEAIIIDFYNSHDDVTSQGDDGKSNHLFGDTDPTVHFCSVSDSCRLLFNNRRDLEAHQSAAHVFYCGVCGEMSNTRDEVKTCFSRHLERVTTGSDI